MHILAASCAAKGPLGASQCTLFFILLLLDGFRVDRINFSLMHVLGSTPLVAVISVLLCTFGEYLS